MNERKEEKTRAWGRVISMFGSREWVPVDVGDGVCVKLTLDILNHTGFKRADVRENAAIDFSYEFGPKGFVAVEIHSLDGISAKERSSVKKQSHQNKRWHRRRKQEASVVQ